MCGSTVTNCNYGLDKLGQNLRYPATTKVERTLWAPDTFVREDNHTVPKASMSPHYSGDVGKESEFRQNANQTGMERR